MHMKFVQMGLLQISVTLVLFIFYYNIFLKSFYYIFSFHFIFSLRFSHFICAFVIFKAFFNIYFYLALISFLFNFFKIILLL